MSMFDQDFEVDESDEFLEEDPTSEEDIALAELGLKVEIADRFKRRDEGPVLTKAKKPTAKFFRFYLECSDDAMVKELKQDLLPANLVKLIDTVERVSDDFGKEHEEGANKYIEMNRTLIQQNKELQDALNESVVQMRNITGNLIFLYQLMGKMEFPEGLDLSENDIEIITGIREAIGE